MELLGDSVCGLAPRRMAARILILTAVFALVPSFLSAETPVLGLDVTTSAVFPVGSDAAIFSPGGQAELSLFGVLKPIPILVPSLRLSYEYAPLEFNTSLSLVSGGAGFGVFLFRRDKFQLVLAGTGGYYYGLLNDGSLPRSGGGYVGGEATGRLSFSPTFGIQASAGYRSYLGLEQLLVFGLGATLSLGASGRRTGATSPQPIVAATRPLADASSAELLQISNPSFTDVFPVFFKYYDEHPIGSAVATNGSKLPITDLTMTVRVGRYTDSATPSRIPDHLEPGETAKVDIMAFFNESVLEITEATKVSAEVQVDFKQGERQYSQTYTQTLRLHDRNSMTWDDNRKTAAYVTARDPEVMSLTRLVSSVTSRGAQSPIPVSLRSGIALHAALAALGVTYTPDPSSPFRSQSKTTREIDYLQFPRQTLQYKGGDCDDLSILYSALLESLGIGSAFVLVPGHIFVAFDLQLPPKEAGRVVPDTQDLIVREGRAWVPFEVTLLDRGFQEAWKAGSREWREAAARDQASFLVTSDCWRTYEPVGLLGHDQSLPLPSDTKIAAAYDRDLTAFVTQTIFPAVADLEAKANASSEPSPFLNRIAVLYGRYGLYDRARQVLEKILKIRPAYAPALINLGNIASLSGDDSGALRLYQSALRYAPRDPRILLSIATVSHRLENYGAVAEMLERARAIDPNLVARFAYLEAKDTGRARAAQASSVEGLVLWEDEQ